MAILGSMTAFANHNRMPRLLMRLFYHYDLLDTASTFSDYSDAGSVVSETVLDLVEALDIHSVPGNEWEHFDELRKYCHWLQALLLKPTTERDTVIEMSREAIEHYCYLLELSNIRLASVIERVCLREEDIFGRGKRHHRLAGEKTGRSRTPGRPLESRHRRPAR